MNGLSSLRARPHAHLFSTQLSMSIGRLLLSVSCALLISWAAAPADAWADWSYDVTQEVKPGERATLSFAPPTDLKRVTLTLRSPQQNSPIVKRIARLPAGKTYRHFFLPPRGRSEWIARVDWVTRNGGTAWVEFQFEVMSARALKVQFSTQRSDMQEGRLVFESAQPLERVEVSAYGDEGELQWEESLALSRRGRLSTARFTPRDITPRRLELKVYDAAGNWRGFRVAHWYAEVPHEDVLFDSGSARVKRGERPKLQRAVTAITEEIEKFRRAMGNPDVQVDLELYVGGYTDTVGSKRANLRLSAARARAIARTLRSMGVELKIRYAGFGERGQLVSTPDSTPEPRNRRAVYIVANVAPSGPLFPNQRWRTLR